MNFVMFLRVTHKLFYLSFVPPPALNTVENLRCSSRKKLFYVRVLFAVSTSFHFHATKFVLWRQTAGRRV